MTQLSTTRKTVLAAIILGLFLVYGLKLFQMQIVFNTKFEDKSTDNSIKSIEQMPLRGVLYDRNQKLLVENIPSYTVRITPAEYDTTKNSMLEALLELPKDTIAQILKKHKKYGKYQAIKIKKGAGFEQIGWLEENSERFPGVDYIIEIKRGYTGAFSAAHVLGYLKETTEGDLKKDSFYTLGDNIGMNGIEKSYEKYLRGEKGYNYILVNAARKKIGRYKDGSADRSSKKGKDLVLSLDSAAQATAEAVMRGRSGAIVAIEPSSGEIIAFSSAPDYDLSKFSDITPADYMRGLISNPLRPQFNRATMSTHSPGSTFKVLVSLAALELGIINQNSTIYCPGSYTYGNRTFKCHGSHGATTVYRALEGSCNVFFYKLIFDIGVDRLNEFAKKFRVGTKTGVDLLEESKGLIPSTEYYEKVYGKSWPKGILVSVGIGQGEVSMTPLQLALMTALIANNGKTFVPHLVKGYLDEKRKFIPFQFEEINTGVNPRNVAIIKKGMWLVVNGGGGTAKNIRTNEVVIAGKTGTVQNVHGRNHSLFVGFAPYDKPKIAVAVLFENAGYGSDVAAPVAERVILSYLRSTGTIKPEKKEKKEEKNREDDTTRLLTLIEEGR